MELIYADDHIVVAVKPARVLSTDEPGGMPELVRQALSDPKADVRTVHRLDRVVSGLMVLARSSKAASDLSAQIRQDSFQKEYLAVVHGCPEEKQGTLEDLLVRDKARKMTFVTNEPGKDAQTAVLHYQVLAEMDNMSLVKIQLITGRTHQIRVQFASRGMPLVGERKYAVLDDPCEIALWSCGIGFCHPATGEDLHFYLNPPDVYPFNSFSSALENA